MKVWIKDDDGRKFLFEQAAKWECECSVSAQGGKRIMCSRPATHVVQWQHKDGDRERRIFCLEHALEQEKYWSAMDWDTSVEVSDVENWTLSIDYGRKTATRVGKNLLGAAA